MYGFRKLSVWRDRKHIQELVQEDHADCVSARFGHNGHLHCSLLNRKPFGRFFWGPSVIKPQTLQSPINLETLQAM